jgi:hypothetical protein
LCNLCKQISEAIVNIQRKALGLKPHDRYNLFDKHGELDPEVVLKSLITGGGLGIWGDLFTKVDPAFFDSVQLVKLLSPDWNKISTQYSLFKC